MHPNCVLRQGAALEPLCRVQQNGREVLKVADRAGAGGDQNE
jgi:hypothetical protein